MSESGENERAPRPFTGRTAREGVVREFWPNGTPRSECGRREDGSEAWTFWYPDGTVQQELVPGEGTGVSVVRRYRPDGTLQSTIEYKDGRKHGAWREYGRDGSLRRERRYVDGFPQR